MKYLRVNYLIIICFGLAIGSCPGGWEQFQDSCYHFSTDKEQYMAAKGVCEYIGGHLVEIETAQENEYLQEKTMSMAGVFWIGLNDLQQEGNWVWTMSRATPNYTNWAEGTPDNNKGNENCAIINPVGIWNDIICSANLDGYICEKPAMSLDVVGR